MCYYFFILDKNEVNTIKTIQERLKYFRKNIENKNQKEFAEKIMLSQSFFANLEKGTRNLTDRTISDICREFNINEEWLRYGTGKIEIETDDSLLARVIEEYNVKDDITINIMKNFLEMDDKDRLSLIEKAQQLLDVKKDIVVSNKTKSNNEYNKSYKKLSQDLLRKEQTESEMIELPVASRGRGLSTQKMSKKQIEEVESYVENNKITDDFI